MKPLFCFLNDLKMIRFAIISTRGGLLQLTLKKNPKRKFFFRSAEQADSK